MNYKKRGNFEERIDKRYIRSSSFPFSTPYTGNTLRAAKRGSLGAKFFLTGPFLRVTTRGKRSPLKISLKGFVRGCSLGL